MAMTTPDFMAIADVLVKNEAATKEWDKLCRDFATMLETRNPRFTRARFLGYITSSVFAKYNKPKPVMCCGAEVDDGKCRICQTDYNGD